MPTAIIFDMDGVIIDSEPIHIESEKLAMQKFGVEISDDELATYTGKTAKFMFEDLIKRYKLGITPKELADQKREFFMPALTSKGEAVPGVIDLIHSLKADGKLLAVGSSSRRGLIDFVLTKLDLTSYFDVIVSADDVTRSKPDPEIFTKAFLKLKEIDPTLNLEDCVVIEDSSAGITASNSAGIKCIGFQNQNSNQDLSQATIIIDSMTKVLPSLKEM
ncbi:MAG: HAD family phosphatase [Candidatus Gracilibacteria bacterium]